MAEKYLTGGEQTTVNSTMTELFPALCFNNNFNPRSPEELEDFINRVDLNSQKSKKTFVNSSNLKAGQEFIVKKDMIRPQMKMEKIQNAYAITKFLFITNKNKQIKNVIWGYREKPNELGYPRVPNEHAGDIFVYFKDKSYPSVAGISLKAGSQKSAEPKLNSYVKTTLTKPMWLKAAPKAVAELKKELWENVYSKIPALPKDINANNYFLEVGAKGIVKPNPVLMEKMVALFKTNEKRFDELYQIMNRICREKLVEVINKNPTATKEWIGKEFRLEKRNEEVPLVLVKAIRKDFKMAGDPLADMLPKIKTIKAYLDKNSVQEWFIDVSDGKDKLTLLMTIRSDSQFRESKTKGKLGAFVGLKLLYRGIK